jgi:hypothetical protein
LQVCDVRFPASLSLRKVAGTPWEKTGMLHVAAFEQGPSLGGVNTGALAVKASKEPLAP